MQLMHAYVAYVLYIGFIGIVEISELIQTANCCICTQYVFSFLNMYYMTHLVVF